MEGLLMRKPNKQMRIETRRKKEKRKLIETHRKNVSNWIRTTNALCLNKISRKNETREKSSILAPYNCVRYYVLCIEPFMI